MSFIVCCHREPKVAKGTDLAKNDSKNLETIERRFNKLSFKVRKIDFIGDDEELSHVLRTYDQDFNDNFLAKMKTTFRWFTPMSADEKEPMKSVLTE